MYPLYPRGSRPVVEGVDGSSYETALRILRVPKSSLVEAEKGWLYEKYWMRLKPAHSIEDFERSTQHCTERRGKSVYDIVTLTLPNGEKHIAYFEVTNYRYWWPKDE